MTDRRDEALANGQEPLHAMDPEVFAAHYCKAYPRLHLIATGIIGDRTHANDIVQEAAVIALKKSDQFNAGASYVAWLSGIVRNCSLNYVKKMRGRRTAATDPDLLAQTAESSATSPDRLPVSYAAGEPIDSRLDVDDEMLHALNAIGADARCCLLLRVVQNLSYAEISDLMKIPEGTAMSHVHRSKRQLQRLLEKRTTNVEVPGDNR